ARPSGEVRTANDITSVTGTGLIPPRVLVLGSIHDRAAEIVKPGPGSETIDERNPDIHRVGPLPMQRSRYRILQLRIRGMNQAAAMDQLRGILRGRLVPQVIEQAVEPSFLTKVSGDGPPVRNF